MNREDKTRQWYDSYYRRKKGVSRNDLLRNPEVLFQVLACEASVVRALSAITEEPNTMLVLDVGCGSGGDLLHLVRLGYLPENITGIDILPERVEQARKLYPCCRFIVGDASRMEFSDATFDLVFESTMFATLPEDILSAAIAKEMVRVCRPGGFLLLVDWRTPKPGDRNYKALTRRRLRRLFPVGNGLRLIGIFRGALVPPLGRFLSAHLPSVYFLVATLFPFLVGQVAYLLQKEEGFSPNIKR